jgi:acyl-CoA thioester hydrolase
VDSVSELLSGYPLITTLPILWGDEDSFAHVNNLAYLRWCETARVEYMHRVAFWIDSEPPKGTGPILANVNCDYLLPLTFPDTVDVGTRVASVGNSSMKLEQVVVSRGRAAVAAKVTSTIVLLDYAVGRPVRVPDSIRTAIAELEGLVRG